jgi:ABC-type oligopeptide transport system ATPase subunit
MAASCQRDAARRRQYGEAFALIGEYGSGKSTIARCIAGRAGAYIRRIAIMGHELAWTHRPLHGPSGVSQKWTPVFG